MSGFFHSHEVVACAKLHSPFLCSNTPRHGCMYLVFPVTSYGHQGRHSHIVAAVNNTARDMCVQFSFVLSSDLGAQSLGHEVTPC
jgi:hypothetical protein